MTFKRTLFVGLLTIASVAMTSLKAFADAPTRKDLSLVCFGEMFTDDPNLDALARVVNLHYIGAKAVKIGTLTDVDGEIYVDRLAARPNEVRIIKKNKDNTYTSASGSLETTNGLVTLNFGQVQNGIIGGVIGGQYPLVSFSCELATPERIKRASRVVIEQTNEQ